MKYTISGAYTFEEKIKKSTFIGNLHYAESFEQARDFIQQINKLHPQANHNCYAYIIGKNGEIPFNSDAGEPPGTAGKPILNAILKYDLSNVCLTVTRYFGGVKLGVRGLIDAYGYIAEKTIEQTKKIPIIDFYNYNCIMAYDFYNVFLHKIQTLDLTITDTEFTDLVSIKLKVSEFTNDEFKEYISDLQNAGKISLN